MERIRQGALFLIWPGPIAGPLPVNLFRILSPILVFYFSFTQSVFIMSLLTALTVLLFFRMLHLSEGKHFMEEILEKIPQRFSWFLKKRAAVAFLAASIILGVFTYAIFLKVIGFPKNNSYLLLITASVINSIIWTGVFWGVIIAFLKAVANFT